MPKRPQARGKRRRSGDQDDDNVGRRPALATGMSWAGTGVKVNTLTGEGTFDPRVPLDQPGEEGDDALIWADVPEALRKRLKEKPQQITENCLMCNAKGILRLYENDITQHVIKQQLRGEQMSSLIRRQGAYRDEGARGELRATAGKLAKSSFLGADPSGERPIPDSLWDDEDELSEKGALLKDVQDTVWNYLRVHLTRILDKAVLARVQAQEELYKSFPAMKEGLHNERMPWSEYKQLITYLLPRDTGMYVLAKVLTMDREDSESAQSWVQRMHKGRQRVYKRMQTNLSDACYRELLFRGLTRKEQGELIKAQIQRSQLHKHVIGDQVMANWSGQGTYYLAEIIAVSDEGQFDVRYAPPYDDVELGLELDDIRSIGKSLAQARAMNALRSAPWPMLVKHILSDVGPQPNYIARTRRGAHMLYTHEQAQLLAGDRKRQRTGYGDGKDKHGPAEKPKPKAGKIEKERDKPRPKVKKRKPEVETEPDSDDADKSARYVCLLCKGANRRHNHPPDKCNYAEGGVWHGLEGAALKEAKKAFFDKRQAARKDKSKRKRQSRKAEKRKQAPQAETARWPWEDPHACNMRRVMVRKKGQPEKGENPKVLTRGRRKPPKPEEAPAAAAEASAELAFQPRMRPRGSASASAESIGLDLMRIGVASVREASSGDADEDSDATDIYTAGQETSVVWEAVRHDKQKRLSKHKPVGKRKREEGPAPASVSAPASDTVCTPVCENASHHHFPMHMPRATGTQHYTFTCGKHKCPQCTFSVVRQEPDRGPFRWQELRVTMCLHGEMTPLMNKLQEECQGASKIYPHLRSQPQIEQGRGFIFPQNTPYDLEMEEGADNNELVLVILPLQIRLATMRWPQHPDFRHVKHFQYSPRDTNLTRPVHSLATSSSDNPTEEEEPAATVEDLNPASAGTPMKRVRFEDDEEEERKRKGVVGIVGEAPDGEEEMLPEIPERERKSSETPSRQLAKAWVEVITRGGKRKRVLAALDSQSNATFVSRTIGQPREWGDMETSTVVGLGRTITTQAAKAIICTDRGRMELRGRFEPNGEFDDPDTHLLLGAKDCRDLGIDVNYALDNLEHKPVRFRGGNIKRKRPKAGKAPPKSKHMKHVEVRTCRISERMMTEYLAKTGDTCNQPKKVSPADVVLGKDLTPRQKRRCRKLLQELKRVFMQSPDDIPPALQGIAPISWKLKEGAEPVHCRKPNWGPAQEKWLRAWTKKALKAGLITRADSSEWASRPVLVPKYRGDTPKGSVPDDIRMCVDYIAVNELIKKLVDQYPDPQPLLRKAAGHKFYFVADAQKQFNSFLLKEGQTQEMTAFWTPLGLMKFTRLIMGAKNSSTIAQAIYTRFMTTHLPPSTQEAMVNFQDDFAGFADDGDELIDHFEQFLRMCDKTGIKLNPAKVKVGVREAKFYGFKLTHKGMHPAEANLDPIKKLVAPTNRKEVRCLLGLFVQFRPFFKRYDRIVLPIQKLLKKEAKFVWGREQEQALAKLKAGITADVYLATPRKDLPLILETDGSDDGWGAILLQVVDGKRRIIAMWSHQWDTMGMRKAPPYYKETKAWMNGLEKARIFIDAHPLPVQCVTDHIPLTWIKHTSGKGPVSQFVLDNLGAIDYQLRYRPGAELVEADATSRYPCLGPKQLSKGGMNEAVQTLLKILPKQMQVEDRLWLNTGKDTMLCREMLMQFQQQLQLTGEARRVPATDRPTARKTAEMKYGLAVLVPPAETCTQVLKEVLKKNAPAAVLMPLSLLTKAELNESESKTLRQAAKHILAEPELVWVVHGIKNIIPCQVHRRQIPYFGPEPDMIGIMTGPPEFDVRTWLPEQKAYVQQHSKMYKGNVSMGTDKLLYYSPKLTSEQNGTHATNLGAAASRPVAQPRAVTNPTSRNLQREKAKATSNSSNGHNQVTSNKLRRKITSNKLRRKVTSNSSNGRDGATSSRSAGSCQFGGRLAQLPSQVPRLIVPEEYQLQLIEWQHAALLHAGASKVIAQLERHFHWPTLAKDVRCQVKLCATCQVLNAKRAYAHKHFRANNVETGPRTAWAMDYYGCERSTDGFVNILGAVDLVTSELRLFATKRRTGAVTTDAILQGIILRDGVPRVIHSDHAREFVGQCVATLSKVFGIKRTTTLAHHPTGNAKIERAWQYITKALQQMSQEQYSNWPAYLRLIEHTWNTTVHATMGVSPFEAAHGLPAASAASTMAADGDYCAPATMSQQGIQAMQTTARALAKILSQQQAQEAQQRADKANEKGFQHTVKAGDKVSFFIPPTAKEAEELGRKVKHLAHFKGPAQVVKQLTPTTYAIKYNGAMYGRCLSELRQYKGDGIPNLVSTTNTGNKLQKGDYVAFGDTDDAQDESYQYYHIGKVVNVADGQAHLLNYATLSKNVALAKWAPLYQLPSGVYTLTKPKRGVKEAQVIDKIAVDDHDYVRCTNVQFTSAGKIAARFRRHLARKGFKHHVLGLTYP